MGWSIGYDSRWKRDIGYGVPASCDHPGCTEKIDRGLGWICGGHPGGGDDGCGLFFCATHGGGFQCARCERRKAPFDPSPDVAEWIQHKLNDESWAQWRSENPATVAVYLTTVTHPHPATQTERPNESNGSSHG